MRDLFEGAVLRAPHTFVVDGEPVAWTRAAPNGHGSMRVSNDERAARDRIRWAAKAAQVRPLERGERGGIDIVGSWLFPRSWTLTDCRAELELLRASAFRIGEPKGTRPDADNVGKLVMDAGNGGVLFFDDGQLWLVRFATVWGPRAETHVRLWYGDAPPAFPDRWWRAR